MRALLPLLGFVLLANCSASDDSETPTKTEHDEEVSGASDPESIAASLFCCTLREYCLACGCNTAEAEIVESKVEAACKQLLDSSEYGCAAGDEMTALAQCVTSSPAPASNTDLTRCLEWGDDGCICREERYPDDVPFEGTCEESSVGESALCCRGEDYCHCEPVLCGISVGTERCICGVGVAFETLVTSCDDNGQTCCTQDTGYCYCEDGCEQRFGNRVVSSCNRDTDTATCYEEETPVRSCEVSSAPPAPSTIAPPSQPTTNAPATQPATDAPPVANTTTVPTSELTTSQAPTTPADDESSEPPSMLPLDADGWETQRHAESAFCQFQQRCVPGSVEADLEACISRAMRPFEVGVYRVADTSEGAASCYDALVDLPCAELDSRDADARDQVQWYNIHSNVCGELRHFSCVSDAECGSSPCSGESGQCGECQWTGTSSMCLANSDCQFGDTCLDGQCIARVAVGEPCSSDYQCVNGRCDDGTCVDVSPLGAECTEYECGFGAWCSDGTCEAQGGVGAPCSVDQWFESCRWGLSCVDGQCREWGQRGTLLEGEHCLFDEQCVRGSSCYGNACLAKIGETCSSNNECAEGEYCAPCVDECVALCDDDTTCVEQCNTSSLGCPYRECRPQQSLGGVCIDRTDCQSDACSDDGRCIERPDCG